MIRLLIIENDLELSEVLCSLLDGSSGVQCVGRFSTGEEALEAMPLLMPDVTLIDIDLGEDCINGIECITRIQAHYPTVKNLIFTIFEDDKHVFDGLAAGGLGYILKSTSLQNIVRAIHELMEGGSPITSSIARKLVAHFAVKPPFIAETIVEEISEPLTKREQEIIGYIAQGMSERAVSEKLFISARTVKTHITNIYQKLHVRTRVEALNKYFGR